jgi:hypothetical protein
MIWRTTEVVRPNTNSLIWKNLMPPDPQKDAPTQPILPTTPSPTPEIPPEKPGAFLTYEQRATLITKAWIAQLCQQIPELRSVCVVFDWQKQLNQVSTPGIIWSAQGPLQPTDLDAILSLPNQIVKAAGGALACLEGINNQMRGELTAAYTRLIHASQASEEEKTQVCRWLIEQSQNATSPAAD